MVGTSSPDRSSAPSTDAETGWQWARRHEPIARAELVDAFSPLVRHVAQRVFSRRVGGELQFCDLVQYGMVGLLEAIDRYDPERGVRFETFAYPRIEGAILNGLASQSELQRQLAVRREQARLRQRAISQEATQAALQVSALERLADLAVGMAMGFMLEDADAPSEPVVPDNAYVRTEVAQLKRQLAELMQQLPQAERRVLHRHYFQQLPFDQIALGLGLSRGRISQLHHAGLRRLRELLRQARGFDASG